MAMLTFLCLDIRNYNAASRGGEQSALMMSCHLISCCFQLKYQELHKPGYTLKSRGGELIQCTSDILDLFIAPDRALFVAPA